MLRVPVVDAAPGMVLAMPLYHPRRAGTVLLRDGVRIEPGMPARLEELGVRELWIKYPRLESLADYVSPAICDAAHAVSGLIASAMDRVVAEPHALLDYADYRAAVTTLIGKVAASPQAAVFIQDLAGGDTPGLRHAGAVCLISVLVGLKLDFYLTRERPRLSAAKARDVTALGVGALLHDIGMLRLDQAVRDRWYRTGDENDPEFRRHVELGFEQVKEHAEPAAAAVVLHHHQRFDGSGFPSLTPMGGSPQRVSGSDIHIFARIAAAADLFDRLRYPPGAAPGSAIKPVPTVTALARLRKPPYTAWIDPVVSLALLHAVPAYAPGSIVGLSDGRRAVVVSWSPLDPCRPTVEVLESLTPAPDHVAERLDLRVHRAITITHADGEDVSASNFYPTRDSEFDLELMGRRMDNAAARPALKPGPQNKPPQTRAQGQSPPGPSGRPGRAA